MPKMKGKEWYTHVQAYKDEFIADAAEDGF